MPQYAALTYTRDVDWSKPEQAADMAEYMKFGQEHEAAILAAQRCTRPAPRRRFASAVPAAATSSPATARTPRPKVH